MAQSLVTFLLIAIATLQVAFATYHYCDKPHRPDYGDYGPHRDRYSVGHKIRYSCNDGYYSDSYMTSECVYDRYRKRASWNHKAPVCKRKYWKH